MYKLTIITVCYNAVSSIEDTILSVISQTYRNIEYIVVDGGSIDGTLDIIKKYDLNISRWISEPDKGVYDAMNKGIGLATGDWINFMNAGDIFFDKNVLESVNGYLNDNIDVLYGNTCIEIENKRYRLIPENIIELNNHLPFCHQSSFVKSSLIKKFPFQLRYRYVADYAMFYAFYNMKCKFEYVDCIVSNYQIGEGLTASNMFDSYLETFTVNNQRPPLGRWKLKIKSILISFLPKSIVSHVRIIGYKKNPRFTKI